MPSRSPATEEGSKPTPSSVTMTVSSPAVRTSSTSATVAPECRATFSKAAARASSTAAAVAGASR